ncbi:MAG: Ger(x)C family spore germination protein [Paenibacillus sp.]|nr:Ger(x)C family spore germination protein [Paenibacillus sp.]
MKLVKIGVVVLLFLSLTGCWSRIELDELAFVFGLYLDIGKEPGTVEVTISTPLPNRQISGQQSGSGGEDGKMYSTVSKTGATITEALSAIQRDLPRRLSLSHIKVVVIGEEYAKKGISDVLEWLKREPGFPLGTYVLASPGRAKEITKLSPIYEQLPSQVLFKFASDNAMFKTTIKDCLYAEAFNTGFVLTYLSFGTKPESLESGKPEFWAGIRGAMLFQKDKMTGILKLNEGVALAWANSHVKRPLYVIHWDEGRGAASAIIANTHSSKVVSMTDKGPVFEIRLRGRASIVSIKDPDNRGIKEISQTIEDKLEQEISKQVTEAIQKTQKAQTDIFHLGLLTEWNYPKEWNKLQEHWEDYYANDAVIKVNTSVRINDFGAEK